MDLLNKAVSNVIASLTFGCRFEYNDPRIIKLLDLTEDGLKEEFNLVRKVRKESSVKAASVLQRPIPPPEGGRAFRERYLQGKAWKWGDGRQRRSERLGGGQCAWGWEYPFTARDRSP